MHAKIAAGKQKSGITKAKKMKAHQLEKTIFRSLIQQITLTNYLHVVPVSVLRVKKTSTLDLVLKNLVCIGQRFCTIQISILTKKG